MKFPKAGLHVHLDATLTPAQAEEIAQKNKKVFPTELVNENGTKWFFPNKDFGAFLRVYDQVTQLLVLEDMEMIAYEYLKRCHEQGVIYVELTVSPDHFLEGRDHFLDGKAKRNSLEFHSPKPSRNNIDDIYLRLVEVVSRAILKAKDEFGVDSRMRIALIRHEPDRVRPLVEAVLRKPHPLVVGFDLAGAEIPYPGKMFQKEYELIHQYNRTARHLLGLGAHSGEHDGPDSIMESIILLNLQRIGHGVHCMDNRDDHPDKHAALMKLLKDRQIGIECCPGSNFALNLYPSYTEHPLGMMLVEKLCVSLGDDDPGFEGFVSIEEEYNNTQRAYGLDDIAMLTITKNAINSAFCEHPLKDLLHLKVEYYEKPEKREEIQSKIDLLNQQIKIEMQERLEKFAPQPTMTM